MPGGLGGVWSMRPIWRQSSAPNFAFQQSSSSSRTSAGNPARYRYPLSRASSVLALASSVGVGGATFAGSSLVPGRRAVARDGDGATRAEASSIFEIAKPTCTIV